MSIYLDYAATTPLDQNVLKAMLPFFEEQYGNPSSVHQMGQRAEAAVEDSRGRVADCLAAETREITFTSGATESNNLAIRSLAHHRRAMNGATRLLTTAVEHPSVLQTCKQLSAIDGFSLEFIPIDSYGRVKTDAFRDLLTNEVAVASIVYANNEIGTVNPISELGEICRAKGVPLHVDAAQAANHLDLNVNTLNVDLLSLGSHKFYGPKGVGVLYHHGSVKFQSCQTGGGQEFGTRAGTHNVPAIVGFAHALEQARELISEFTSRANQFRDTVIVAMLETIDDIQLTGSQDHRLANHTSFAIKGVDSNELLAALDLAGFACSSGSACKTGNPEPSPVLLALGMEPEWALGSLRVTLGRDTNKDDIDSFVAAMPTIIQRLRSSYIKT